MVNKEMEGRIEPLERNSSATTAALETHGDHIKNLKEIVAVMARDIQKIAANQEGVLDPE